MEKLVIFVVVNAEMAWWQDSPAAHKNYTRRWLFFMYAKLIFGIAKLISYCNKVRAATRCTLGMRTDSYSHCIDFFNILGYSIYCSWVRICHLWNECSHHVHMTSTHFVLRNYAHEIEHGAWLLQPVYALREIWSNAAAIEDEAYMWWRKC